MEHPGKRGNKVGCRNNQLKGTITISASCLSAPPHYTQTDLDRSDNDAAVPAAMDAASRQTCRATSCVHLRADLGKGLGFDGSLLLRFELWPELHVLV
jgi:hypothetical protein